MLLTFLEQAGTVRPMKDFDRINWRAVAKAFVDAEGRQYGALPAQAARTAALDSIQKSKDRERLIAAGFVSFGDEWARAEQGKVSRYHDLTEAIAALDTV